MTSSTSIAPIPAPPSSPICVALQRSNLGPYDCIILTQTLHVIDDMGAAMAECYRILKPGGVLLATFPAASRVCLEYGEDGDCWRMTPAGARALVRSSFEPAVVSCEAFGNVLTNTAFLHGLGAAELTDQEFDTLRSRTFPPLRGSARRRVPRQNAWLHEERCCSTIGSMPHRMSTVSVSS